MAHLIPRIVQGGAALAFPFCQQGLQQAKIGRPQGPQQIVVQTVHRQVPDQFSLCAHAVIP